MAMTDKTMPSTVADVDRRSGIIRW
jgi:hypothetical protein